MIGTLGKFVRDIRDKLTGIGNPIPVVTGFKIPEYDYVSLGYSDGKLTEVVYKNGGVSGTIAAELSLTYDISGNLASVTREV